MNIRSSSLVAFLLLLVFLVGCSETQKISPDELPDIGVSIDDLGKDFRVKALDSFNTFKIGENLRLTVEITSNEQIAFEADYGARIYMKDGDAWQEVENFMTYPEGYLILANPYGDATKTGTTAVDPILPDQGRSQTLRIFLIGRIYRNGSIIDEKTAAFIDVVLEP